MPTRTDSALIAADLRVVIGQLIRRLRKENLFPLNQASVAGVKCVGMPLSLPGGSDACFGAA